MNGFFIAGYVLFGLLVILDLIYLYTTYMYTKHTLFTKAKYKPLVYVFYGLVSILLLIMGILFATTLKNQLENENIPLHLGLTFTYLAITLLSVVAYTLITYFNNKNKIPYDKIPTTDFKPQLEQLKTKIGDINKLKTRLLKYHKNYFNALNESYSELLLHAKDQNFSQAKKLADIVMFNDAFAHKWCTLTNNYQLLLTYEILTLI